MNFPTLHWTLDGTRKQHMDWLVSLPLLIIDDLGMRKLPLTAAEDLLETVMRSKERASTIETSNRSVDDWGKLLGDAAAVSAMLDQQLCSPRQSGNSVSTAMQDVASLGRGRE
jgi:DNA replication protein DnaC